MKKLMDYIKDPKYRQTLKKIVSGLKDLEEKYKNDDLYDDYYEKWQETREFEYSDIGASPQRLHQLNINGVLETTYNSSSHTMYKLAVDEDELRESLTNYEQLQEAKSVEAKIKEEDIPDDLFDTLVGETYEDIKDLFRLSLNSEKPVHILMVGPPGTAKSVLLMELSRLPHSEYLLGSGTTSAGLSDYLFDNFSDGDECIILLDEIDKMEKSDYACLLSLQEGGLVKDTKSGKTREMELDATVYGACNRTQYIPKENLDRFENIQIPEYSMEEFRNVVRRVLMKREGMGEECSVFISNNVPTKSVRQAVRIGRLSNGSIKKAKKTIRLIRKFGI